jgi:D-beta-D-heptose 7-phosphate kinase/D-beta-D-heptose 1-phosphate adenosyltransferase
MIDFEKQLADLRHQTVLCVGDLMLDEFVYGEIARISPEAPAPVIAVKRSEVMMGGAGNVARNIAALGARCIFVALIGDDEAGRLLKSELDKESLIEAHLIVDAKRPTTRKVRFVSEHYATHLLRADWEDAKPADAAFEEQLIARTLAALPHAGALVLSDYAKGALTPRVIGTLLAAARAAGKPSIVDPKQRDIAIYRGATVLTPNRKELSEAMRQDLAGDSDIVAAAREMARISECKAVLVKRSDEGMTLVEGGNEAVHVPAYPVRVRDVSGGGDTVAATLAALLAGGASFEAAMRAANAAAAVVVAKPGTASVTAAELRARLLPAAALAAEEKVLFDWARLDAKLAEWRGQGLRIGFTNGCFDLLHPGHVRLLTQARAACDRLIVGLNSDASVTRLKGSGRPVQPQQARAEVLAALEAVDLVVVFEQDTPLELIGRVRPRVLVKGADYTREQVVGHEIVEADGGEVLLVEIAQGHSTTDIVHRSRKAAKQ